MQTTSRLRGVRRAVWRHVGRFLLPPGAPKTTAATPSLTEYVVTWRIHIEADSPERAALVALAVQRDADSAATCFEVEDEAGARHTVVCPTGEDPMSLLEESGPRRPRLSLVR